MFLLGTAEAVKDPFTDIKYMMDAALGLALHPDRGEWASTTRLGRRDLVEWVGRPGRSGTAVGVLGVVCNMTAAVCGAPLVRSGGPGGAAGRTECSTCRASGPSRANWFSRCSQGMAHGSARLSGCSTAFGARSSARFCADCHVAGTGAWRGTFGGQTWTQGIWLTCIASGTRCGASGGRSAAARPRRPRRDGPILVAGSSGTPRNRPIP